jgi:hypothetical protein
MVGEILIAAAAVFAALVIGRMAWNLFGPL